MAMGGMACRFRSRTTKPPNAVALAKVRADKKREATAGHDGTWVAHPGLEAIARAEFDAVMTGPNQLERLRDDVQVATAADLLRPVSGTITAAGVRSNIRIALLYLSAWLGGNGCVPIDNLMEDAATAEISRAQLWQWIRHPEARLESGAKIDGAMYPRPIRQRRRTRSGFPPVRTHRPLADTRLDLVCTSSPYPYSGHARKRLQARTL